MSRYRLNRTVVMIGMMGAGKTAVGTALAHLLDVPFVDSDQALELAANASIAEIFSQFGERFFRGKESQVLKRLLDGKPCILSTGGGAFLRAENRALIGDKGVAVWLKADDDLLWARVKHKTTRPLLHGPDPRGNLIALLRTREVFYRQAGVTVTADANYSVQDMAEKVRDALLRDQSGVLKEQGSK